MGSPQINGIHFVGSVPVPSAKDCFRTLSTALPGRLKRIPDGEPGTRENFVRWQMAALKACDPRVIGEAYNPGAPSSYSEYEIEDILRNLDGFETRYDDHALSSYETFRTLKDESVIEQNVRFLVCLPTPINVVCLCVHTSLHSKVEQVYEQALLRSLERIQDSIPHDDLSIQLDCPIEMGLMENANFYGLMDMRPWFEPVLEGVVKRLVKVADSVAEDVELGIHLCYGDIGQKHFMEPRSTLTMVDFSNAILENCKRPMNYIHMPVPKDRTDSSYFEPLRQLKLHDTELILGLVHYDDLSGTKARIQAASVFVKSMSVSTECGLGRLPPENLNNIFSVLTAVSTSIRP